MVKNVYFFVADISIYDESWCVLKKRLKWGNRGVQTISKIRRTNSQYSKTFFSFPCKNFSSHANKRRCSHLVFMIKKNKCRFMILERQLTKEPVLILIFFIRTRSNFVANNERFIFISTTILNLKITESLYALIRFPRRFQNCFCFFLQHEQSVN